MWASAGKAVAKFSEGVITAMDGSGYPVSVRQVSLPYDGATGTMPITMPELGAVEGPACLLCHYHDEKLWNMRSVQLKGRLEKRGGTWVFVTTAFAPQSPWQMIKNVRRSSRQYWEKRGLPKPVVDFDVIARLWERAKQVQNP